MIAGGEEQAREATDPTRQDFYQVLERYFRNLANDFKQVIEKRKTAWSTPASEKKEKKEKKK